MSFKFRGPLLALSVIRKNVFPSFCEAITKNCYPSRGCNESKNNFSSTSLHLYCSTKQVLHLAPIRCAVGRSDSFLKIAHVIHNSNSYVQTESKSSDKPNVENEPKKMSIFQKFKAMYRDYWYVLVPVHLVTSAVWFGGFYYMATSGADIAALAETLHFSDETVRKIRENSHSLAGHLALSYLLYKIVTPLRYTVTVGGTTISINYLKRWGYIKPMPKKEELKKILDKQKVSFNKKRENFRARKDLMKRNVIDKITSKKRIKKSRDLIKKILHNRRVNKNGGCNT